MTNMHETTRQTIAEHMQRKGIREADLFDGSKGGRIGSAWYEGRGAVAYLDRAPRSLSLLIVLPRGETPQR